jgi:ElaA protein
MVFSSCLNTMAMLKYRHQMNYHANNTMSFSPVISSFYLETKAFEDLTLLEFYAVAKLRQDVFILEQQSIYQDLDGLDQQARHVMCYADATKQVLTAYARYRSLAAKNDIATTVQIERMVVASAWRGQGLGEKIMHTMLQEIDIRHASCEVSLSAQLSAQGFYHKLGFINHGDIYDDGGIDHIGMLKKTHQ